MDSRELENRFDWSSQKYLTHTDKIWKWGSERKSALLQFRHLRKLGTDLTQFHTKVLEILVGEGEEEVYNAQYFAAEEHRRKLDVTDRKFEE